MPDTIQLEAQCTDADAAYYNTFNASADANMTSITEPHFDRKRTQNRLAQRKHRSKLKQRIEELEEQLHTVQASSSSAPSDNLLLHPLDDQLHASGPILDHFSQYELANELLLNPDMVSPFTPSGPVWGLGQTGSLDTTSAAFPLFTGGQLSPPVEQHCFDDSVGHFMTSTPVPGITDSGRCVLPGPPTMFLVPPAQTTGFPIPISNEVDIRNQTSEPHMVEESPRIPHRLPHPTEPQYLPTPPQAGTSDETSESGGTGARTKSSQLSSMDRRISFVLDSVHKAGFDSFDELAAEYYTSDELNTMSAAFEAQRTSRSRGLRQVLETVRQKTASWSEYERSGYKDEIFRAAEALYRNELLSAAARNDLRSEYEQVVAGDSDEDSTVAARCRVARKMLQDQAPNLWNLHYELKKTIGTGPSGSSEIMALLLSLAQDRD